ncbi:MAG: type II toxin-antitoxin system VapC family toxin [Dehalococcoidia bacterium]
MLAIVDSGPLYATVDRGDQDHVRSLEILRRPELQLIIPTLVVAEVTYLIAARLGAEAEAGFLEGLTLFEVEAPSRSDWRRIAELVRQYRDFPLGGADASVVALAERLNTDLVITLDQRHFRAIRPLHAATFRILPGDI